METNYVQFRIHLPSISPTENVSKKEITVITTEDDFVFISDPDLRTVEDLEAIKESAVTVKLTYIDGRGNRHNRLNYTATINNAVPLLPGQMGIEITGEEIIDCDPELEPI